MGAFPPLKSTVLSVIHALQIEYPDSKCTLDFKSPYELLTATMLSAQTTDAGVNKISPKLFEHYPSIKKLANADQDTLIDIIRPLGLYNNKSKSLIRMANSVMELHQGEIPKTMKQLVKLAGVGRKTANVVLGNAFGISDSGITIDTHMIRLMNRLSWIQNDKNANRIERNLMKIIPVEYWVDITHLIIDHGRKICSPKNPDCNQCVIEKLCPSSTLKTKNDSSQN